MTGEASGCESIRFGYILASAIRIDGVVKYHRDDATMKTLIALFVLFFSFVAHAVAGVSPGVGRTTAELMGDVVYFQVDNSARARERLMTLLGKVEAEAGRGLARDDAKALVLTASIRQLLQAQVNRAPYDANLYKGVVDNYEGLVRAYQPETSNDQSFMVLDLRYRYLSKVLAAVEDGTISSAPLQRSLEEAHADAERVMQKAGTRNGVVVRKWGFLRTRVLDYNRTPIPALANSMTLSIAGDLAGAGRPLVVSAAN